MESVKTYKQRKNAAHFGKPHFCLSGVDKCTFNIIKVLNVVDNYPPLNSFVDKYIGFTVCSQHLRQMLNDIFHISTIACLYRFQQNVDFIKNCLIIQDVTQ